MKATKLIAIELFLILIFGYSCSNSDNPDGLWDDNIKLSQKEVQFTAAQNSITITTEGEWWWIHQISMNRSLNFDISRIDTTSKNFVIDETEFKIERKNATEIHIEMTRNQTGAERVLLIGLEAGDYFDRIEITQSAN